MDKKIKVGLMAYGMSGKIFHAPFINAHEGFELAAITERSKNEAVKDYPNVTIYKEIEQLLNDDRLDLVIINTPNYTHYEYAKAAINAGKNVLIEKPFSVTKTEAEELFSLGFRKGLKVLAFQNRRFDSDFLSVQKVIGPGKLGKISEAHIRFDRYRNEISAKSFKEDQVPGSGVFYDLGAHIVDQAIALFGIPSEFIKTYGKYRKETEVDDYAQAHLKYPNGLNVFVTCNMLVVHQQPAFIFYGENGTLIKNRTDVQESQLLAGIKPLDSKYGVEEENQEGVLYTIDKNGKVSKELLPSEKGNYMLLFDEVYKALKEDGDYFVKQNDILGQLSILEK
ncbi:Gfo/Idh/MocA family oxidoreductase [Pedobacter sp. SD-b]|uniref:Gfo/Idh/MocA family oxidoreductase n=1 Tax=Pedobacter segetis TaxID=2793069 RepID=A0ABS1BGH2_9SPHI|nr:Gfo/Idh/MocA family oxidoreductase [Pedobacter segetis]MBK0381948.1 Gfo/Idh/MocA family oxidoreductase [Pedobacter segetis]